MIFDWLFYREKRLAWVKADFLARKRLSSAHVKKSSFFSEFRPDLAKFWYKRFVF